MDTKNKAGILGTGMKSLAIVGAIIVVLLAGWGAINLAKNIPSALSGLATAAVTLSQIFIPNNENLDIVLESTVVDTDVPFSLSFEHSGKREEGSYVFSYSCREGFNFEILDGEETFTVATCETPTAIGTDGIELVPVSKDNRFLDVNVAVAFVDENGDAVVSDERTITVVNDELSNSRDTIEDPTVTPTTPRGTTRGEEEENLFDITGGTSVVSDPNGLVDLAPRILEVGTVDRDTNEFTPSEMVTLDDRVAVRFEVENLGTRTSDVWSFVAVLPTHNVHFFNSPTQRALAPGERIEFTLGFDGIKSSETVTFTVNVDEDNSIGEASEANNIAKVDINVVLIEE